MRLHSILPNLFTFLPHSGKARKQTEGTSLKEVPGSFNNTVTARQHLYLKFDLRISTLLRHRAEFYFIFTELWCHPTKGCFKQQSLEGKNRQINNDASGGR